MRAIALTGIGSLVTNDKALGRGPLGVLKNATVVFENGRITAVHEGRSPQGVDEVVDVQGSAVVPGFVDSHAHLMFAGDRWQEFEARMNGLPYSAGGIRTTVQATRQSSDALLVENLDRLTDELRRSGVTTFETKSGYGLTTHDEQRALRIASTRTPETTFLGAHVVPTEYADRPDEYVHVVIDEMIPACAPHARWIDVFCDTGAFDADQAEAILRAGIAAGMMPRLHANQLHEGPGVQLAVRLGAASADHCTHLSAADIDALAGSSTVATLLPGAEFSTRSPYPDARRLVDASVTVALATDCNPGSSYTTSMPLCIALAVRDMHMTPDEALWAATAGGARALRRDDVGVIRTGSRADLVVLRAPSHVHLAYRPGVDLVDRVYAAGRLVKGEK